MYDSPLCLALSVAHKGRGAKAHRRHGCSTGETRRRYFPALFGGSFPSTFSLTNALRPDVVTLEEVQNCDVLRMLMSTMGTPGNAYRGYIVKGTDTYTSQNVALMTKVCL